MRVPIAVQLAVLVLFPSLLGLAVISVAIWINNYNFVVDVKSQSISSTAALKASQISGDLELAQSASKTVASRILIQAALKRLYLGNDTKENWAAANTDIQAALGSGGYTALYQATIYPKDGTGNPYGVFNVTGSDISPIELPYSYPNGSTVILGDPGLGYPPRLYPNLTYSSRIESDENGIRRNVTTVHAFPDVQLRATSTLLLGPFHVNATFSLLSVTLPIINNTSATDILGFMTVVASAARLQNILRSRDALDSTGISLLLGPANPQNRFPSDAHPATRTSEGNIDALNSVQMQYVFEPSIVSGVADRHNRYHQGDSFALSAYPAVATAFARRPKSFNNASTSLKTTNEEGSKVAVGIARPQSTMVDWIVVVEQTHAEAWAPVIRLRNIILACVFGVAGFIALIVPPLAHLCVAPIRRLRDATKKTMDPPMDPSSGLLTVSNNNEASCETCRLSEKEKGFRVGLRFLGWGSFGASDCPHVEEGRKKPFCVPGKVEEKRRWVTDELTELSKTYNEMSDELMIQYTKLEERVAERTRELEISKKAAEVANESKTLFIANISHELKTPLNGILGMCAVCMGDDNLPRIKKSLRIVYKSGELLLHLLNDLLTFSKNEIDKVIQLDQKEFYLADIKSQILAVFQNQIQEKHIDFGIHFVGAPKTQVEPAEISEKPPQVETELGPPGTASLKDMVLWGDQHRLLQILINLVSNSLKFTPEGGRVEVRIKCLGEVDKQADRTGRTSTDSKLFRRRSKTPSATQSKAAEKERRTSMSLQGQDQLSISPPIDAKPLMFAFEVEDTGPGIPQHLQQRVFEPFMQGDPGLSKKYGGTGLGLSICSQLSQLMNGTIRLQSIEGIGTTFVLRIPLQYIREVTPSTRTSSITASIAPSIRSLGSRVESHSSTSVHFEKDLEPRLVGLSQPFFAAAPPSPPATTDVQMQAFGQIDGQTDGKIRVLVAEDNVVNQEVVLRMLKLEDVYDVTIAKDGQEAYDVVKANMEEGKAFNLILMDIQMPNLDGLQSTRLIREMGYSAPIVALSAFAEESNIKDCMDSGMNMFLR
ncbi:conserved hypothetical protein [Uncinocarpus reesii 1704]|uniref:histidine kinase n=1 Tax=Uncinocarpus reesii (strain UAMH 1704) TaxID=336963 RepID=C4JWH6_UNCRE|nr:uncharacterized protein UREG_06918 [Uncinocarpus reesii 1704]EEP82053.1 conserved hypothetical protein [Uncinocarpus reesii 1704]